MADVEPIPLGEHLFLLPLDLDRHLPGFKNFISAWLYRGDAAFLVDVGPAATAGSLLAALKRLGVGRLDAVFLTHIHLDHAGGLHAVAESYPEAPVVCHAAAMPHLADPARLWQGSLKVLGDMARAYGSLQPVPAQRLVAAEAFQGLGVTPFATPGHAPHHVSYGFGDLLFAGEAGGVFIRLDGDGFYLRPATPPRFFLETHLQSIDTLLGVAARRICYGHFGASEDPRRMLHAHRDQLQRWAAVVSRELGGSRDPADRQRCVDRLLAEDPLLAGFRQLDPAARERERYFLANSVAGFADYLAADDESA